MTRNEKIEAVKEDLKTLQNVYRADLVITQVKRLDRAISFLDTLKEEQRELLIEYETKGITNRMSNQAYDNKKIRRLAEIRADQFLTEIGER